MDFHPFQHLENHPSTMMEPKNLPSAVHVHQFSVYQSWPLERTIIWSQGTGNITRNTCLACLDNGNSCNIYAFWEICMRNIDAGRLYKYMTGCRIKVPKLIHLKPLISSLKVFSSIPATVSSFWCIASKQLSHQQFCPSLWLIECLWFCCFWQYIRPTNVWKLIRNSSTQRIGWWLVAYMPAKLYMFPRKRLIMPTKN